MFYCHSDRQDSPWSFVASLAYCFGGTLHFNDPKWKFRMFWGFQWSRQNSVLWDTLSEAHTELIYKAMAMNMLVQVFFVL